MLLEADGTVLNPEECVTPAQALAAITEHAAWQIHADDRGRLAVGNRADFAVVSEDPWTTEPEAWPAIEVHETYIDGISAVSPPISAQPAWRQPSAMPFSTS